MCSYAAQSGWETTDRYGNELSLEWLSPENDNTLTDREKIGVAARIARHIGYEHLAKDVEEEELEQEKNDLNGEHYSATSVKSWPNGFPVVYTHTSIAAMKGSYKGADAAKNAQINPLPDGYQVSVGKLSFGVHSVEQITPDTSLFTVSYGREMQAGERIAGAVRNGEILIAHIGDRNTLRHESWHLPQ